MSQLGNEIVARYLTDGGKTYHVYGCWDEETKENEYDYFDLYEVLDGASVCLNLGDPFYEMPSLEEVKEYVKQLSIDREHKPLSKGDR